MSATREQMDWLSTTDTAPVSATLRAWRRVERSPFGRWLFVRSLCRRAPYVGSIAPQLFDLKPGFARVGLRKRRRVLNHLGSVHALAIGSLCELAAGMVTEVTIPSTLRWIPRGMTIEYLRQAKADLIATARLDKQEWPRAENVGVPVTVIDAAGEEVVRAVITMYVSPRVE